MDLCLDGNVSLASLAYKKYHQVIINWINYISSPPSFSVTTISSSDDFLFCAIKSSNFLNLFNLVL